MAASIGCRLLRNCGKQLLQKQLLLTRQINSKPVNELGKRLSSLSISKSCESPYYQQPSLLQHSTINSIITRSLYTSTFNTRFNVHSDKTLLRNIGTVDVVSKRTKVRYSKGKGKPKTVKSVVKRFMHLDWGAWIRTRSGRHKLWKTKQGKLHRLKQHVFCTKNQSKKLSHMVSTFWTKPKYYVDDPYRPYHKRTNLNISHKERPPFLP